MEKSFELKDVYRFREVTTHYTREQATDVNYMFTVILMEMRGRLKLSVDGMISTLGGIEQHHFLLLTNRFEHLQSTIMMYPEVYEKIIYHYLAFQHYTHEDMLELMKEQFPNTEQEIKDKYFDL